MHERKTKELKFTDSLCLRDDGNFYYTDPYSRNDQGMKKLAPLELSELPNNYISGDLYDNVVVKREGLTTYHNLMRETFSRFRHCVEEFSVNSVKKQLS